MSDEQSCVLPAASRRGRATLAEHDERVKRFFQSSSFLAIVLLLTSSCAAAVVPETGIYKPRGSGSGLFVEVQGNTFGVIWCGPHIVTQGVFDCVQGGGALHNDGNGYPFFEGRGGAQLGFFPLRWSKFPVYRIALDAQSRTLPQRIADVEFYSMGTNGLLLCSQNLPALEVPQTVCVDFHRMPFGVFSTPPELGNLELADLSGDWIFVDQQDRTRTWRLRLQRESYVVSGQRYSLRYRDAERDARVDCQSVAPPITDSSSREGCTVYVGGVAQFGFMSIDAGIDRIEGFRGSLPSFGTEPYRGDKRVFGFRLPGSTPTK